MFLLLCIVKELATKGLINFLILFINTVEGLSFHQIPISEKSKELTTFLTHSVKFAHKRLSLGLKNSVRLCQIVVDCGRSCLAGIAVQG